MGILNIGTQALQANLVALQTTGNNIANANTTGYSREQVIMQAAPDQYFGSGYIGEGVGVQTVQRQYDTFLGQQATATSAVAASDQQHSTQLQSLQAIFQGGTSDVGQSISDMLNAFSGVASTPADLTARTVALTSVNETAARIQQMSQSLDQLQAGVTQPLNQMITNINTLANNIAQVNQQIAAAPGGSAQPDNTLLDKRDNLINQLNQLIQTTQIPASDGTVGVFVGGSQALVLGSAVSPLSVTTDSFGDPSKSEIAINRSGTLVPLAESALGGGQVAGLLKFQNVDLTNARNLLGRLTMATTTAMNTQQNLGLDMNGNPGADLFAPATFNNQNILSATTNAGTGSLGMSISDVTKFQPSDYQVQFTSPTTGNVIRLTDGTVTAFPQTPPTAAPVLATVDGLNISLAGGTPAAGDSFLLKPFNTAASNVQSEFSSPRSLAVASPVAVTAGATNQGSLTVSNLSSVNLATPIDNYSVQFSVVAGATTYNIVDNTTATTVVTGATYTPGQAITWAPAGTPGWSLTLTGAAANGDTMTVEPNPYPTQDGGNAKAIANLRDTPMFDGAALTDGYAAAIAQVGIWAQTASYSATVSTNLATNASSASNAVSGVNLDEEASKLLQYQQAYQAASKMIQIAQSIFTTLMQNLQ